MSCVNTSSKEFKTLLDKVDISSATLELIIHKIQNTENNDRYPSVSEINEILRPQSFEGSETMIEIWSKQYSSPINFPTIALAREEFNKASRIFGKNSVSIIEKKNGTYDLMVGNPTFESEYKYILSNAKRDSEGNLLAPNGKKSNLTERQYAQVRTKEFKEWFGDWENDPENASKVVDENGEPLVVYHGTSRRLNNNSFNSGFIFASNNDIISAGYGFQRKGFSVGIDYALSNFAGKDINSFRNYIDNLIKGLETEIELGENMPFYQEGDLDANKNLIKELKKAKQEIKNRDIFKELKFNIFNLFQNVKNPLIVDAKGKYWHSIEFEETTKNTNEIAKIAKDRGYDGLIITNVIDKGAEVSKNGEYAEVANDYIVFNPNQVKSATDNIGTFSRTNDRIDYYNEEESAFGISYNGESKIQLQSKIDDRIKSIEKERGNLSNVLSLMDIAKEDFKNLPLERKVGALRRKAAGFNKSYNTRIKVDDKGNIIHNLKELDSVLSELKNPKLADNLIDKWHKKQASLRQEEINKELELLNREDYISEDSIKNTIKGEKAIAILKQEGVTLDNSLINEFLSKVKSTNPYHQLFKQVVEILRNNNIPINIVTDTNLNYIAARKQDNFKTATIRINPILLLGYLMTDDKANIKGNIMKIVTHELIHAVTAEILESHPSWAKVRGFDKAQTEFTTKTWNLYLQCKEQLKGTRWYGLKNAKEFIAVALTDRNFQVALSKIKVKEKSAFKRFINYITDLFNKIFEVQGINIKDSVLEEVISISQEYFDYANKGINKGIDDYLNTIDYYEGEKSFEEYTKYTAPINETTDEKILNGKLAFTRKGNIVVSRNVNKEDIFKYIKGEIDSPTSEQKKVVFDSLAKKGYTEEKLRELIQTDEDAKKLLAYHELSHKYWEDSSKDYYEEDERNANGTLVSEKINWLSPNKIEVEKRATLDAIHRIELEKGRGEASKATLNNYIKVVKHKGNWSRAEAIQNPNILYVFTDNTDRDSGSGKISDDSWYSKNYGKGHHFPTMTAAVVRGLDNARPISTQRWYHQGAKGPTGRWTDADINEFKKTIKEELQEIINEFNTNKYDTIMFPDGDGLFNTRISNITKERTPKLYQALGELLHEFGLDSLIPSDIALNTKQSEKKNTTSATKIISGGQTGIDTIELQVAKELGIETGGKAPKGFLTTQTNKREKEQDLYTLKQQEKMQQIDNLLGDNLLSATEVRHIAEQAVYWISDHITELQENPELAKTIYGDRFKNEDGTDKDFASMTRADVVRTIGVDNIVEMCKQKFSPEHNDFDNDDTLDKAFAITDNWQAIMLLAQDSFLNVEDFSIVSTPDGKANEVNEDLVGDVDNFNESNDQSDVEEIEGSLQEHWQIESRCQDVLGTMSQMVKRALLKCYILDKDGNNVQSEFGINERINVREATNSILRWTQGSLSLADMITKLQEKQEDNPWVKQLIDRLSNTSGKETDFQGQFYGTFSKHFQPYSVVIEEDGKYKSIQVNENPALKEAMTQITTQYKIGEHPLFTTDGINKESFKELRAAYDSLEKFRNMGYDLSNEVNKDEAANTLGYISNLFGYYITPDMVKNNLTKENYKKMYSALGYIIKSFENNLDNASYEPFKFKSKDSINGNMREFLKPITEQLEDIAVSAFYDSGKMYQSYVTPSYMSKLMQKFSQKGEAFDKFLTEEFGNQPWFHEGTDIERGWRNSWLRALATDSKAREIFKHKVQLNFNKHNYMRNMNDMEYTLSLFTEYFSEGANDKQSRVPAWFRVPMLSNKPSSEFIRFYSERGTNYKETITDGMMDIFNQELSRIQTVLMRNLDSKDPRFIKSFDKNGKKFCFLDFMNDYLTGDKKNSELGKLINDKVNGKEVDEAKLYELANKAIFDTMDARAKAIVEEWIDSGLMEGAKKISGIGTTEEEIKSNLENFVWNDTFAAMNIMELTVTDIAYYKDAEDLQKRLAQIHAPGIRGNVDATDYEGNKVSDGKERTFYLKDWDDFISNIIDNVSVVFDRKIAEAPEAEKDGYRVLKDSLVGKDGAFRKINVADAQGYSSPTSYRKKAFIFGKWSKKAEDIYQKLRKGDYNYNDLSVAFQPLKPFVYSQIEKSSGIANAPLDKFRVPVQNKNSEYLLIMADAILQNENTGRPNLLRAIYEVMEESHYDEDGNYKTDGIDTVQFESTVKSGLMGRINLNKYVNDVNGEAKAKAVMEACLYETTSKTIQEVNPETGELEDVTINTKTGKYSQTYVHELPFEDYCLQQEVPEHFKNHEQVHGSQLRYIVVSELATKDSFGNDATYEVEGRKVSADEFKAEYEQTIADSIEDSISELESTLGLNSTSTKDRNIALSKILQREILSSPRYGVDLLQACSVDENGRFRIPLGDPIQSKRVEQLINSIIKNRINKQEIAGGPVVQVTNFGTSRELNIRFKDKNGGLLMTRAEYEKNPIKKELSQTDKFNAKYKGLKTSESTMSYKDYIKENQGGIAYFEVFAPIYTNNLFSQFADKNGNISIEALEALDPDLLKMIGYRIPTEAKYSMAPLKIVGFLPREAGDGIMLPNDITLLTGSDFDVDKEYLMRKDYNISRNKISKSALHKILYDALVETQSKKLSYETKNNLNDLVRQFLEDPFDRASLVNQKTADGFMSIPSSSYSKLLKLYLQNAFTVKKPTEGRIYRNNKIVDMTYEVLTHETSCAEMLNPGGFDQQKRMGYLVTALRTTDKSYEELSKMSIDELKDLTDKDKNLMFVDTHVQFYKQNSAASSLIGIFAVNRTAHAVIENEGYMMNVDNACGLTRPFTVADMTFGGNMPIDVRFDNNGQSVGKVLGSLVASAADAVKDPVLNLMNINSNTANILNTLVRLGMPFDDAALFLSQRAISNALNQFSSENITGFTSLSKVVDDRIKRIEKDLNIDENSSLNEEELTREQLIKGVKSSDPRIEYKVLKAFRNFQRLADAMRMPTFATRFNSISSAVGPLIIDNLITEHKMEKLSSESNILGSDGEEISINDIFLAHPILNQFRRTLGIAQSLFGNMPANSTGFRNILTYASENPIGDAILSDRKVLSSLSDFYQSYLVVAGNVVNSSDLSKVISEFPKEFMEKNYKKQYDNNLLIQSIKYGTDKGGRATLQIDITGLDTQQKERLSSAWIDLHKVNPELSEQLFKYCFFRAGIGFSPKTFMSLVPVYVKERLNSYVDTFRVLPSSTPEIVLDQFIRNNWDNNRLVPRKENLVMRYLENGNFEVYKESDVKELQKTQYFKMKVDNVDKLYQQVLLKDNSIEYKEVAPLGSNKDYLEISVDGIDKPLEIPSTSLEDNEKSEISSTVNGEAKLDESTPSKQEQIDLLHQIYMTKGKTFTDADKTIQNYKGMDNEFKKAIESQVKKFMKSRLETLGVKFDEKTIEEEYKKLC